MGVHASSFASFLTLLVLSAFFRHSSTMTIVNLEDYKPPRFKVSAVHLVVKLDEQRANVEALLSVARNPTFKENPADAAADMELDAEFFDLKRVAIQGQETKDFTYGSGKLIIPGALIPEGNAAFELSFQTESNPSENFVYEGLYLDKASKALLTQMESAGMRRLIPFFDRPDHQATYQVRLEGDKTLYPVLLSNGKKVQSGDLEGNRHFAVWEDEVAKPCYLLCMIGAKLEPLSKPLTLRNGKEIQVTVWGEPKDLSKLELGVDTTINSIKWDEHAFDRLYPYDNAQAVAFSTYNQGAMENASLITYNSTNIMFDPSRDGFSSDAQAMGVVATVSHEVFHTHSGNLTTIQSPFYLSLKEGLTTAREQLFCYDQGGKAQKRIEDVSYLRSVQFPEDAGPLSRPVILKSYQSLNALYSTTTYSKGAELFLVLRNYVGGEIFKKGLEHYFDTTRGRESTLPEFMKLVGETAGKDLTHFSKWFYVRGTPTIKVLNQKYDLEAQTFSITIQQVRSPRALEHGESDFLMVPILTTLIGRTSKQELFKARPLELSEEIQTFVFENITEPAVVSLLRDFSAPVYLESFHSEEELIFLAQYDTDPFNRWEAGQTAYMKDIVATINDGTSTMPNISAGTEAIFSGALQMLHGVNDDPEVPGIASLMMTLPSLDEVVQRVPGRADPPQIREILENMQFTLAKKFEKSIREQYAKIAEECASFTYSLDTKQIGFRNLKNTLLSFVSLLDMRSGAEKVCREHLLRVYNESNNFTESYAAYSLLLRRTGFDNEESKAAMESFLKNNDEDMRYYTYLRGIALSNDVMVLDKIAEAMKDSRYDGMNPNIVRSLALAFCYRNVRFFTPEGISFALSQVRRLGKANPMLSQRFVQELAPYKNYAPNISKLMLEALRELYNDREMLPQDVTEVVENALELTSL